MRPTAGPGLDHQGRRHILDTPRETSFESDELQEYWVEEVRSNRRIFILGLKWKF